MLQSERRDIFRFLDFELDVWAYELRRGRQLLKLERQPMDLLILLVERHHQLVSRSDIVEHLWGRNVFVDVETGINTAIRKIRNALGDAPDAPACVETVPGKGYRFVAPVEVISPPHDRRSSDAAATWPAPAERTGIYYLPCLGNKPLDDDAHLRVMDAQTGKDREFGGLERFQYDSPYVAVSPDDRAVLYARTVGVGADLMILENFR